MSLQKLIRTIETCEPRADTDLVRLAYEFAAEAHKEQKRASGEPYIVHPLATAQTLAELKLPIPIIIAGLLHDVPEDTTVTLEEIKRNFGAEVAHIVRGITKLGKIKYRGIERYIENLRKMFIAMASDVRVIFVKFADRLHNLETLEALPPEKRRRIALETLEIYAPIANRLGMGEIKGRLEDLAFKYAEPKEYLWVQSLITGRSETKERYLKKIARLVEKDLASADITFRSVHGRAKHIYSLYKKLLKYDRDIAKIHDLVALRIIVPTVADCYAALGIVHSHWKPLKGRIKDYIAQPKPNGYQSLHTTVFCEDGEIVEFQIRTEKMHDEAEYGIAAHWTYDEHEKESVGERVSEKLRWIKEFARIQKEIQDRERYLESLETLKIDVFQSRIFVFTPKGDVIDLPEESTPIDFAYAIHSEIGDTCVGATVNDQMVALETALKSGDVVNIVTDKNRKGPSIDWLAFIKTASARGKIRAKMKPREEAWMDENEKGKEERKKKKSKN